MSYIIIAVTAAVVIAILIGLVCLFTRTARKGAGKAASGGFVRKTIDTSPDGNIAPPPACPVCRSPLSKGEHLRTKVFRPMTVHDQSCFIYGCPHCYPAAEHGVVRRCPVCRSDVPPDGHLVARLFNKGSSTKSASSLPSLPSSSPPAQKSHVIVTGCPVCCH